MSLKSRLKQVASAAIVLVFAWFVAAGVAFRVRHPWATEAEELVYIRSVLTFERVPYDVMRPRESR